jgi:hypothetical protein
MFHSCLNILWDQTKNKHLGHELLLLDTSGKLISIATYQVQFSKENWLTYDSDMMWYDDNDNDMIWHSMTLYDMQWYYYISGVCFTRNQIHYGSSVHTNMCLSLTYHYHIIDVCHRVVIMIISYLTTLPYYIDCYKNVMSYHITYHITYHMAQTETYSIH